jgi:hypothetical protein
MDEQTRSHFDAIKQAWRETVRAEDAPSSAYRD